MPLTKRTRKRFSFVVLVGLIAGLIAILEFYVDGGSRLVKTIVNLDSHIILELCLGAVIMMFAVMLVYIVNHEADKREELYREIEQINTSHYQKLIEIKSETQKTREELTEKVHATSRLSNGLEELTRMATQFLRHSATDLNKDLSEIDDFKKSVISSYAPLNTTKEIKENTVDYMESGESFLFDYATKIASFLREVIEKDISIKFGIQDGVRVGLKIIDPGEESSQSDWKVKNSIWDSKSYLVQKKSIKNHKNPSYRIKDYSALGNILLKKTSYFVCNDLAFLHDAGGYHNPNKGWEKRYNSKLILPVWNLYHNNNNYFDLYGFLSIDSMNTGKNDIFVASNESVTYNVARHAAECLAIYCQSVFKMIDDIDSMERNTWARVIAGRANERKLAM